MPQCAIVTCNNTHRRTKGANVRYHRFPGDNKTRMKWIELCGKTVSNSSTARVCSHHFSATCYERDVQHELLGLPSRCRLKKGAVPDINLPQQDFEEEALPGTSLDVLLAVGLIPSQSPHKNSGGLPLEPQKMRMMEDVGEGCMVQPSSPGHAELHPENETTEENGLIEEEHEAEVHTERQEIPDNSSVDEESDAKEINATVENIEKDVKDFNDKKRKHDEDITTSKKFKLDMNESFYHRNKMFSDYMEMMECEDSNSEQLQMQSELLQNQIRTLNDLAREKEMEWNSIIHLKKFKEELLLRIERKKQISLMNENKEEMDENHDESQTKEGLCQVDRSVSNSPQTEKTNKLLSKSQNCETNGSLDSKQSLRYRPTLDVQSIIADYRQRHPENVPRRGKRIRNNSNGKTRTSSVLNFSSVSLGSGSQMKQNTFQDISHELNLILNTMDSNSSRPAVETSQRRQDSASFKNMLLQLAKLSQTEENEILQNTMKPPPPYPEVTVHPVATSAPLQNSLLHGILTKTPPRANHKKAYSPTLARLLTASDQSGNDIKSGFLFNNLHRPSGISISEMLATSKEEDRNEDSNDRLIIDEGKRDEKRESDNNSDLGDDVPQCQGCNKKMAQFVCAGCGNQWYCSRDCQVAAWDEHSEVCCG